MAQFALSFNILSKISIRGKALIIIKFTPQLFVPKYLNCSLN